MVVGVGVGVGVVDVVVVVVIVAFVVVVVVVALALVLVVIVAALPVCSQRGELGRTSCDCLSQGLAALVHQHWRPPTGGRRNGGQYS